MLEGVLKKMSAATLLLLGCQGLLLFAMQIVSQRLGKTGYGQFGLAMSISVYASQFIQWGMDQLLTVKFARGSADDARRLLGLMLRQKQLAALVAILAAGIAALGWADADARALIFLGAVDGVCLAFTMPSIFDARGKTATWQFFAFLRHSIYLAALLLFAAYYRDFYTPVSVVSLHLVCIFTELFLEQIWIRHHCGAPQWPAPASEAFALWREAAPMALAVLAQQVLFNCGQPILRALGRDAEAGGLYLSNQFTIGAASFIVAPGAILHARLALHAHEGAAFRRRIWRTVLPCALAGIVISLTYPLVGGWIVRRFFKNLADSTPAILFFDTWRLAPILASVPLCSALICLGRLRAFAASQIVSALIGIITAVALVPKYGALAVAGGIATGSCVCFLFVATLVFFGDTEAAPEHAS